MSSKEPGDKSNNPIERGTDSQTSDSKYVDALELTLFQQEILLTLANQGPTYGLGIKRCLEAKYDDEVNHGRLYPNLDQLVEMGLVEKGERDRRTNDYRLSSEGRFLVRQEAERRNAIARTIGANDGDA